jgi:S-DNA-T family DNA segregation ATPase FtsK/SpoIIIE
VSLLQRALGVGYGRGARLIDFMAEDGVVGQYAGSQAREVLLTMEQWAARNGTAPLPPDPAPRKLTIKPHAVAAAAVAPVIDVDEEVDREEAFVEDEIDEDEDTSDEEESSTDVEDSADEWEEEDGDESEDWDDEGDLEDDEDA